MFNLCHCLAEASYPHDPCCPWPYYNHRDKAGAERWRAAFEANRAAQAAAAAERDLELSALWQDLGGEA